MIGAGAIALGAATALLWQPIMSMANQSSVLDSSGSSGSSSLPETQESDNADGVNTAAEADFDGALLGHKPYEEAEQDLLVPVVLDGSVRLRPAAAESFAEMVAAARADGVRLQPLSGFRTEDEQSYLFFQVKEARKQGSAERAAVSAPPGYSEHHTGYAIDIGDATQPGANVSESFEDTAAFEWLEENASAYSFELSFEGGTETAVSYEPWHWRFVGDRHSLETFYIDKPVISSEEEDLEKSPDKILDQTTTLDQQSSEQFDSVDRSNAAEQFPSNRSSQSTSTTEDNS